MVLSGSVCDGLHIVCVSKPTLLLVAVIAGTQALWAELLLRVAGVVLCTSGCTVAGEGSSEG